MEIGDSVVMCWCSRKMRCILDDPLSIRSRMPTCSAFLGGASTYIFPETLHWDIHDLLAKTAVIREEFIILAPFGGEPVRPWWDTPWEGKLFGRCRVSMVPA